MVRLIRNLTGDRYPSWPRKLLTARAGVYSRTHLHDGYKNTIQGWMKLETWDAALQVLGILQHLVQ